MNFFQAIKSCTCKFLTFSGRAPRSEYWYFYLFLTIGILATMFYPGKTTEENELVYSIFILVTLLPSISVTIRRLHDIDRSGWWYWILFVPVVGPLIILYWACMKGTDGDNRFGPSPIAVSNRAVSSKKTGNDGKYIFFAVLVIIAILFLGGGQANVHQVVALAVGALALLGTLMSKGSRYTWMVKFVTITCIALNIFYWGMLITGNAFSKKIYGEDLRIIGTFVVIPMIMMILSLTLPRLFKRKSKLMEAMWAAFILFALFTPYMMFLVSWVSKNLVAH